MSGEDDLIARHFAPFAGPGALGLLDDAAVIEPPAGCDLVVTADAVVAGVHFLPDDPPDDVARKALRVNLSDLAAKGARPLGFVMTLALPRGFDDAALASFAQGLREDAEAYACPLLGGDTVATPGPLSISITAFGAVPCGRLVRRSGARAGDVVYVTGTIGDAALGLLAAQGDPRLVALSPAHRADLVDRYRRPRPRNALADALRECASAAMDVSDGFAGDLVKMLGLAGLSAVVDVSSVPLSPAARTALTTTPSLIDAALSGGDDYEILCAIPVDRERRFTTSARMAGVEVARIAEAVDGGETRFVRHGAPLRLSRLSFSHV